MYLHLGQETIVPYRDIIGIFDLDTATVAKTTRDFLRDAEKAGEVRTVSMELPKSFILSGKSRAERTIYISQISTSTLLKRTQEFLGE